MKNIFHRGLAMFIVILCLSSMLSLAFAENRVVGWPSSGEEDTTQTPQPTDDSAGLITGNEDTQEVIDYKDWGENDISATINKDTTKDSAGDEMSENIYAQYSDTIPDVSIDDLVAWSNRKGFEIIKFLQTFIQPFAIILFMISAIMVLVGSISNSQIAGKGMAGLVFSVLVYAGVIYAGSILTTLVSWLGS